MKGFRFYFTALMLVSLLGGCIKEGFLQGYLGSNAGEAKISLNLPAFSQVETRSGSTTPYSDAETIVESCYVLVFSSDGVLKNMAEVIEENIGQYVTDSNDFDDYTKKEVLLDISVFESIATGDEIYVFCNPLSVPATTSGLTRNNMMEKFLLNASYGAPAIGLPMYGSTTKVGTRLEVDLRTAVAKMQVKLADSVGGSYGGTFINTNASNAAKLTYNLYQWTTTTYMNGSTPDLMEVNHDEFEDVLDGEVDVWQVAQSTADHYTDAIYPYPFPFSKRYISTDDSGIDALDDTKFDYRRGCILLVNKVNTAYKYYRLDLYKDGKYLDIKANTHYILTITAVHSDGYDTAAQALMHPPGNVEFNLESTSVQLVSNGQYALSVDENSIKTYIDFTRHPHSPAGQYENMDLTTLRRLSSEDAIIVPTHGTPFTIQLIDATTTTAIATTVAQMYRVGKDGTETACANNFYSGFIDEDPDNAEDREFHKFVVKFNGAIGTTYNFRYTVEMENIYYTSPAYVFVSNYMFNSYETWRTVNIGRTLPSDIQWNMYGTADLSSGTTYTFSFNTYESRGNTYPSDNSVPSYWVKYTHLGDEPRFIYSTKDAIGAIPRFKDKILIGTGHDTKIVIKQARPLYVGKVNGTHYIAANYDYLNTTVNASGYYTPGTATYSNMDTHINQYGGNGWSRPRSYLGSNAYDTASLRSANYGTSPATILTSDGTAYETNLSVLHSMYRYMYAATDNTTLQYFHNIPRPATLYTAFTGDQYYYQFFASSYYFSNNYADSVTSSHRAAMRQSTGAYVASTASDTYYCRFTRIIDYSFM